MGKKRATKRKVAANDSAVKNEEENHEEDVKSVENGVASTSKSNAGKKKKSVATKAEPKTETSKSKAKSSKSKSDTEEDEEDYEVEKILDVNYKKNGKKEFLIRWKNYSAKHDTWEPEDNLSCDELIVKFLEIQEQREKQPRKDLRENPKAVARYAAQAGRKRSKRTAGTRKSYTEAEDEEDA